MIIQREIVKTEDIEIRTEAMPDLLDRILEQEVEKRDESIFFEIRDSDNKTFFLNVLFQSVLKENKESNEEDQDQQSEKIEENHFVSQFVKSSFNSLENMDKEHQEDEQESVETGEVLLYLVVLDNGEFNRIIDSKRTYNDAHEQFIIKISSKKMFTEKELERNGFLLMKQESNQLEIEDVNFYFNPNFISLGIENFYDSRHSLEISSIGQKVDSNTNKKNICINTADHQFIFKIPFDLLTSKEYINVMNKFNESSLEDFKNFFVVQNN